MKKTIPRRCAVSGGIVVCLVTLVLLVVPGVAGAYTFDLTDARDWARSHYDNRLYQNDYYDCMCTAFVSLTYRKGADAPFRDVGYFHDHAWWVDPDACGPDVVVMWHTDSWTAAKNFNDFYAGWAPSGTSWTRVTSHRCSIAPVEDDRWSGGHIVFYHDAEGGATDGGNTWNYYHSAVIYARHMQTTYAGHGWGTCKVERTGQQDGSHYRDPSFVNMADHRSIDYRKARFVSISTLVND
jgi:hypothetical protein